MTTDLFTRMTDRYRTGDVPWDSDSPPPEVLELVATLPVGRALDLGCGYGRTAIYLARLGWQVTAIDFVEQAIAEAQNRAAVANVTIDCHVAPLPDLSFLSPSYQLAIDVGCGHNFTTAQLQMYQAELGRLLEVGGRFLWFARLQHDSDSGLDEVAMQAIFKPRFDLVHATYGETHMPDRSWHSAWFLFQKNDSSKP
jgi:cyclopropane fatty-acyl-phospholipid synthase-like methyltransferase